MSSSARTRITAIALAAALSLSLGASAADLKTRHSFKIPAQPLDTALLAFSNQSKVQVLMWAGTQSELRSAGAAGDLSALDALKAILSKTGLTYRQIDGQTIAIVKPGAPEKAAAGTAGIDASMQLARLEQAGAQADKTTPTQSGTGRTAEDPETSEGEMVVTGTQIRGASPTANIVTFTREEIDRQGFTSAEDIVRSLTFNRNNQGSQQRSDIANETFNLNSFQGLSAPDLRGLGMGTTLVLVNGRRLPTSAMTFGSTVDLSTIPLASIERVEVMLDGASSIYGADAVGGVINFIMRKDYTGMQARARYSDSSTGGDARNVEATGGWTWNGGNLIATAAWSQQDPVQTSKLVTSQDFRSRGGRDLRSPGFGPMATFILVNNTNGNADSSWAASVGLPAGTASLTFPVGLTPSLANAILSRDATAANLPRLESRLPLTMTSETTTQSLSLSGEQTLTSRLVLEGSAFYSTREAASRSSVFNISRGFYTPPRGTLLAPLDPNAPLVRYRVNYSGLNDVRAGFSDARTASSNTSDQTQVSLGLRAKLISSWELRLGADYSRDSFSRTGRSTIGAQTSNPPASFNPFSAGGQSDAFYAAIFQLTGNRSDSTSRTGSLNVTGDVFTLPGGVVKLALGTEYRDEQFSGERKAVSRFGEINIPIVGRGNALPGIRSLLFTASGRHERYDQSGDFEDDFGNPVTVRVTNLTAFSPAAGLRWQPIDDLTVRYNFSRSYNLPQQLSMFNSPFVSEIGPFRDRALGRDVDVSITNGGNPDLDEQVGKTQSLSVDWKPFFAPRWNVSATYHDIDIDDYIGSLLSFSGGFEFWLNEGNNLVPGAVTRPTPDSALINLRDINFANFRSRSYDFRISHALETGGGTLHSELSGTRSTLNELFLRSGVGTGNRAGTMDGPSDWVLRSRSTFDASQWSATAVVNYESSYVNTNAPALRRDVDSYTTLDLQFAMYLDRFRKGWRLTAGAINVLDEPFPFFDNNYGFEGSRVDFRKRRMYLELRTEF